MSTPAASVPRSPPSAITQACGEGETLGGELTFVAVIYLLAFLGGSMAIGACGPGCCFVFFSVFAGVSGLLMLRRRMSSRVICLIVLFASIWGMWHEKEARDSWQIHYLRRQLEQQHRQDVTIQPSR